MWTDGRKAQWQKLVMDDETQLHLIDCDHMTKGLRKYKAEKLTVRFPILDSYGIYCVTIAMCQPVEI